MAALPCNPALHHELAGVKHIGPTAQDFHAAFALGTMTDDWRGGRRRGGVAGLG